MSRYATECTSRVEELLLQLRVALKSGIDERQRARLDRLIDDLTIWMLQVQLDAKRETAGQLRAGVRGVE